MRTENALNFSKEIVFSANIRLCKQPEQNCINAEFFKNRHPWSFVTDSPKISLSRLSNVSIFTWMPFFLYFFGLTFAFLSKWWFCHFINSLTVFGLGKMVTFLTPSLLCLYSNSKLVRKKMKKREKVYLCMKSDAEGRESERKNIRVEADRKMELIHSTEATPIIINQKKKWRKVRTWRVQYTMS